MITRLVADVSSGSGDAAAAAFTRTPHWEAYRHFDPAGLYARSAITAFVHETATSHDHWRVNRIDLPVGDVGPPDQAVYEASITVETASGPVPTGAKMVIDCRTREIRRMVGPRNSP